MTNQPLFFVRSSFRLSAVFISEEAQVQNVDLCVCSIKVHTYRLCEHFFIALHTSLVLS